MPPVVPKKPKKPVRQRHHQSVSRPWTDRPRDPGSRRLASLLCKQLTAYRIRFGECMLPLMWRRARATSSLEVEHSSRSKRSTCPWQEEDVRSVKSPTTPTEYFHGEGTFDAQIARRWTHGHVGLITVRAAAVGLGLGPAWARLVQVQRSFCGWDMMAKAQGGLSGE